MSSDKIRNFCIIAHIDHGKSTLADRLMEKTNTISQRLMKPQLLDKMDLEREKGITIKLAPVRMKYKEYELNLIDTPGHVDFSYEVSRSLQACEGAILVVDASQGIQAQTIANVYLALEANLKILPVINKIDLPAADIEKVSREITKLLGNKSEDIFKISAKNGQGIDELLDAIINKLPAPVISTNKNTRALIFDSYFDEFRGVTLYVRIFDGQIKKNDQIKMMSSKVNGLALEVGALTPEMFAMETIHNGEIGYIVTNLKTTSDAKVGDTVTLLNNPTTQVLPGYKDVQPFVYAGFYPSNTEEYNQLKTAVDKLSLSDSSLIYQLENSPVLGFGLRIGFLGLLHLDIVRERLEREYNLSLIVTNPSTDYQVILNNDEVLDIKSASDLPDVSNIKEIKEPWIKGEIITPKSYIGNVIQLINQKRGQQKNISYIEDRAIYSFTAPLANLLTDFYDQLKSITNGYGSFNYELDGYKTEDLVRLDFYIASQIVSSLSLMVHRSEAETVGRSIVTKLKDIIPKQNFQVALQAAIGGRFIAREDIKAYRKDVTSGLYGGDVTRKKKVLAKQAKGKARLKRFGKVDIPAEAFTVMLKRD
ncbi:MAG TPA: translation elongation factor 4 [Patescibacteria group bacterium]|nr:translation elongation factor 4 [Patescibacteria group bacterium]